MAYSFISLGPNGTALDAYTRQKQSSSQLTQCRAKHDDCIVSGEAVEPEEL